MVFFTIAPSKQEEVVVEQSWNQNVHYTSYLHPVPEVIFSSDDENNDPPAGSDHRPDFHPICFHFKSSFIVPHVSSSNISAFAGHTVSQKSGENVHWVLWNGEIIFFKFASETNTFHMWKTKTNAKLTYLLFLHKLALRLLIFQRFFVSFRVVIKFFYE
jgi:hypothetical protein